jgi:hypothetical protein
VVEEGTTACREGFLNRIAVPEEPLATTEKGSIWA